MPIVRAFVPSRQTISPITPVIYLLVPFSPPRARWTALIILHQIQQITIRREESLTLTTSNTHTVTELIQSLTSLKATSLRPKTATNIPTARLTQITSLILSLMTRRQIRMIQRCVQFMNIEIQTTVNVNPTTPDLPQLEPLIPQLISLLGREREVCPATFQGGNKMEATQALCLTNVPNTLTFWMVTTVALPPRVPASSEAWVNVLTARVTSAIVAATLSVPPVSLPLPTRTP